jgi:hypothetical protein
MIVNPMRRCRRKDCVAIAEYGIQTPLHCENHQTKHDICLIERECTRCKRIDRVRDGLCINFCRNDDDDKRYRQYQKVREKRVIQILTANYRTPTKVGERCQSTCAGRHAEEKEIEYDWGTHKVFVEVDENQHRSYCAEGEIKRMINIHDDEGGVPILFIRYNPDASKKNKTPMAQREKELIRWLRHYENLENLKGSPLSVHYLYYDHDARMERQAFPIEHGYPVQRACDSCGQSFYIFSYYTAHVQCHL